MACIVTLAAKDIPCAVRLQSAHHTEPHDTKQIRPDIPSFMASTTHELLLTIVHPVRYDRRCCDFPTRKKCPAHHQTPHRVALCDCDQYKSEVISSCCVGCCTASCFLGPPQSYCWTLHTPACMSHSNISDEVFNYKAGNVWLQKQVGSVT